MKKVLLIDNYDSFTYNLVQYLQELGAEVIVRKNNEINATQAEELHPDFLIFSPGPGTVECEKDVGNSLEVFEILKEKIPILGVCLGHQMIGKYFGAEIAKVSPMHGKKSVIKILEKSGIFENFPDEIQGMRYHSLVVKNPPEKIKITARTGDNIIMALEIPKQKIYGVQFHPESIGTKIGMEILENFLNL